MPLDFNGFLSHLVSGNPYTPRGALYRGPPTPRSSSKGPAEGQQQQTQEPFVTAEAAGAPTAAAAAILEAPHSIGTRSREGTRLGGARMPSFGELQYPERGFTEGTPGDDESMLHSCRSTDSDREGTPSWSHLPQGAPSYPSPWFTEDANEDAHRSQGASRALRRPSPPARGSLWYEASAHLQQGPVTGARTREFTPPRAAPGGPAMQQPLDYRVLAEEAREALAAARKKKEERQFVGASEVYLNTGGRGP